MTLPRLLAALVNEAKAAGWAVDVKENGSKVDCKFVAPDGAQTVHTAHLENAFVAASVRFLDQPKRRVSLRNVSAARKQMFNPPEQRPVKEHVRAAPTKTARFSVQDEWIGAPMDSNQLRAFSLDDSDSEVLLKLAGKVIYWRDLTVNRVESIRVPEELGAVRITKHPHNNRRMIQVHGVQLYLDRIRRVEP